MLVIRVFPFEWLAVCAARVLIDLIVHGVSYSVKPHHEKR